ncbi:ribonuclease P protein component [Porticoccaceae bacterium LTM1]|nr:ribonuclease P protein component [Porticoccaceae bacterium LTM1]
MSRSDFSRSKRLLNASQFQNVFDGTRYKVGHAHLLLLATPNSLDHPRLGLVVAKKNVRFAVSRNRFKRAARESFRLNQEKLAGVDIICMARRGIADLDKAALNSLMTESFKRLAKKLAKDPIAEHSTCVKS